MERWLCIHAHFYQPPRENPWLEYIERQDSAYPFHDWNQRITAECYGPNALSRILDKKRWVVKLVNNYSKISFNFGPTLLSWMEEKEPEIYASILEADELSQNNFSGHGSAIAQAYNHVILPLANRRDKETQIIWGLRDFEKRFRRSPESLWLPETAVDMETLEILAAHGLKYVILAPRQAKRVRRLGSDKEWTDVSKENIDPKQPYLVRLPGGKSIAAFFYDGPVSRAVAFEGLLHNGERFAGRLMEAFDQDSAGTQLVHIATDGETYGHHHRHGEMALSYALHYIENQKLARLTNYAEFLEKHPPNMEVGIFENSSWSCVHGIERWRSDCGCNSGSRQGWNQSWRAPLREAFDHLRDRIEKPFESLMKEFTEDPWVARNAYIDLILDRSSTNRADFLAKWCRGELTEERTQRFLNCLELQRQLQLVYTSCAWFFDEVSGIETVQNLKYAYRAVQLAEDLFKEDFTESFRRDLEKAASNIPEVRNAKEALDKYVAPSKVDLLKVSVHFAISSLFEDCSDLNNVYCYEVVVDEHQKFEAGKVRMVLGKAETQSIITTKKLMVTYAVLHFGDHNLSAGVRPFESHEAFQTMAEELKEVFYRGDFPSMIRSLDKHFGSSSFSLKDLFRDDQLRILDEILSTSLTDLDSNFKHLYNSHYALMCYLSELEAPLPRVFSSIVRYVQNVQIEEELAAPDPSPETIQRIVGEARRWGVVLDNEGLNLLFQKALERLMDRVEEFGDGKQILENLVNLVRTAKTMPFGVDLWHVQNRYYLWGETLYKEYVLQHRADTPKHKRWLETFEVLGHELKVRLTTSA